LQAKTFSYTNEELLNRKEQTCLGTVRRRLVIGGTDLLIVRRRLLTDRLELVNRQRPGLVNRQAKTCKQTGLDLLTDRLRLVNRQAWIVNRQP
jgi:hypothetical protein